MACKGGLGKSTPCCRVAERAPPPPGKARPIQPRGEAGARRQSTEAPEPAGHGWGRQPLLQLLLGACPLLARSTVGGVLLDPPLLRERPGVHSVYEVS